jgi:hypothetical protein
MREVLAAVLVLLPLQTAFAQSPASQEKFSCDAPGGAFSRYQRPIGSTSAHLTAKVRINQLRGSGDWRPVVNVMLRAGETGGRAGFRLIPNPVSKKTTVFVALPGMKGGEEVAVGEAELDAEFVVAVNVDASGINLSVNGVSKSAPPVPNADWSLDLSCSSVDSHIDEIMVRTG